MIVPLLHRIIVKQHQLVEVDKDHKRLKALGLELAKHADNERAQAGVDKGVVVSIGPTAYRDFHTDVPIKVGDTVAFARFSGKTITDPDDEVDYVALNDEDIVAILTEDK